MFINPKTNSYSETDLDVIDFVCAMLGYAKESFHSKQDVSNAEMCFILTRLFVSIPAETEKNVFYKDHWAARYIAWVEHQLSKSKNSLWFNEKDLNSSVSCEKVDEIFQFFFKPLIHPDCWPNEVVLKATGNATRLKDAYKIFCFCLYFFYQIQAHNVMELLGFWKSSFVSPYRLLLNISATGMVKTPKLKDASDKKALRAHPEPVIINYAKEVIDQIKYYIKPIFYKYENEIRHFSSSLPQLANVYPSPRPGEVVPRLYCELNKALKVKSIMLGPKCPNPNHIALFLYRCGVPEVRMSRIEFK